jgi:DNA-binding NtrC family response regulator
VELNNSFLLFYRAEKMSLNFQKKLVTWKQNGISLREAAPKPKVPVHKDRAVKKSEKMQKILLWKEHIDLLEVGLIFVSDRAPWELVEQGVVMRELVSGSVHIPVPPLRECPKLIVSRLRHLIINKPTLNIIDPDPLKYWTKPALDAVSSFHWPDNLAGLKGLVDTLFFKGVLRSGKDQITEDHIRGALWEMYGPASLVTSELPVQTGSNEFELLLRAKEPPPDRSKWIEIFQEKYQGKPGAVSKMARDYGINRSLLSTTLNEAGISTGKGGRPRKEAR